MLSVNVILAVTVWILLFAARLIVIIAGLVIVPFAMPAFSFTGSWQLLRLAWWASPWDNAKDGLLGDTRLHYWRVGDQFPEMLTGRKYLKAYWWLAIRNPANNFSRFYPFIGCDLNKHKIRILAQGDNWTFTTAGLPYYCYSSDRLLLGHKLHKKYIGRDFTNEPLRAWKGITFRRVK